MMDMMNIEEVVSRIKSRTVEQVPVLIGIDGFGGAGKSTVAKRLSDELGNCYIICIDDFIIKEHLTDASADKPGFDRARLEKQVLSPVCQNKPVMYQKLEWVTNTLSEPVQVPRTDYLIVEGVSSCHPDIAGYYDYAIWVDTPIEVAKERGRRRDAGNENEQHWDVWAANDIAYQEKYHPELRADFVVRGS